MAVPTEAFKDEMWELLPGTQVTPVVPWGLPESRKLLPPYLLSPLSVLDDFLYGKEGELMNGSVKIVDFGNGTYAVLPVEIKFLICTAFRKTDKRRVSNAPDIISAPEVRFFRLSSGKVDNDWDLRSDIWTMACSVSPGNVVGKPKAKVSIDL